MDAPAIAIIGGGPCGLTLARLLECKGIDYLVFERDASEYSNRSGGSLDIHGETGQQALDEAGLLDEFKRHARYDDTSFTLSDKLGKRLIHTGQGRDAPEIDRVELRQLLLDAIPKEKIRWGHTLTGATIGHGNNPSLEFSNGVVLSGFKLVVGADGAWSKVRSVFTDATPKYSGKTNLESSIDKESPIYDITASKAGPGTHVAIGSGKLIVTQRQGNGSYRNYFGIPISEDFFRNSAMDISGTETIRDLLLSNFYADWSDEYQNLIRHATRFRAWPLYTLSVKDMGWKSVPGFTLAGDAAHLAIPNGEGVNLAMTDSLKLAFKIAEHGTDNLAQAVQEYEADMFPRAVGTISEGKAMLDIMYAEDPQSFLQLLSG
ncbi:hypothetical protein B0T26DRAFT_729421 [Lasiosphaeria miniovina]|uniref:FAD-binding domain-containing protein n=1 Tax=Lasiosphaeria miniovina TaxID=1954250 RepID=A0AA39ZT04_9PEZI|nr:uncharacterized protein B0T26DRAFT_729421 [Lasiosphaeria miniovina]KAK0702954.1 hypothetical protein B0T26DRAFT_729421 [Lasiosphaeria miniovina]